jgi:hypothetical protein
MGIVPERVAQVKKKISPEHPEHRLAKIKCTHVKMLCVSSIRRKA